jgi:hypothetical protein
MHISPIRIEVVPKMIFYIPTSRFSLDRQLTPPLLDVLLINHITANTVTV